MKQELNNGGFTLVELLVAMGLFVIVVGIASGAFIQSLRTQRAATELMAINDNLSQTIELIARESRGGKSFTNPAPPEPRFTNPAGNIITYRFNSAENSVEKRTNAGEFLAMTASNIVVRKLEFITGGLLAGDELQPRITIVLQVSGKNPILQDASNFIQTTISP